jgi:hypothetical protein
MDFFQQRLWIQVLDPLFVTINSTPYMPYNLIFLFSFNV